MSPGYLSRAPPSTAAKARRPHASRLVLAPEPAERVGEDRLAVLAAVEALAVDEGVVIPLERQGLGHLLVGQGPVAVGVVEVVGAVLEEDADRLLVALADQGLVVVPPLAAGRAAGDVGEAADPRQDLAEIVGTLPGHGPGAD